MRAIIAALILTGCTPAELDAWLTWYQRDPTAAITYANQPHIQTALHTHNPEAELPGLDETPNAGSVWDELAECESGQRWDYNGSSGYDGGLQFAPSTWDAYNGDDYADKAWQASREQQITIAERVLADVGWGAWPACSRKLGLR